MQGPAFLDALSSILMSVSLQDLCTLPIRKYTLRDRVSRWGHALSSHGGSRVQTPAQPFSPFGCPNAPLASYL